MKHAFISACVATLFLGSAAGAATITDSVSVSAISPSLFLRADSRNGNGNATATTTQNFSYADFATLGAPTDATLTSINIVFTHRYLMVVDVDATPGTLVSYRAEASSVANIAGGTATSIRSGTRVSACRDNNCNNIFSTISKVEQFTITDQARLDQHSNGSNETVSVAVTAKAQDQSRNSRSVFTDLFGALPNTPQSAFKIDVTYNYETPAAVVPLPAAMPLMLAGLGALGVAARRRKNAKLG